MTSKLHPKLAKARALSTADLDELIEASELTQFQLGELVGIDDRAVRRLLDPERKRADRLDLKCALAERLGKERRSNEAIGGKPRTLLVSVEPPIQPSVDDAHGGQYASGKDWVAQSGASASMPCALYEFAKPVHGQGSPGGESAAEAPVAQPGSAPRFNVGEVARSNRASGSVAGSIPAGVSTGAGCDSGDGDRGLVPSQVGRREERSTIVSQQTCSFGNESAGSRAAGNSGAADLLRGAAASLEPTPRKRQEAKAATACGRVARQRQPATSLVSPGEETAAAAAELVATSKPRAA